MAYKLTISLTDDQIEAKQLVIEVEKKPHAEAAYHSLRKAGSAVKAEMSKDVEF